MKNTFSCSSCKFVIAATVLSFLVIGATSKASPSANQSSELISKYGAQSRSIFKDASSIKELLFLERPSRNTSLKPEGNSSDSSTFYREKSEVVDINFEKKYEGTMEMHLIEDTTTNGTLNDADDGAKEGRSPENIVDETPPLTNVDETTTVGENDVEFKLSLNPTVGEIPSSQPFEMPDMNGIAENIIPVFSEWTQKQMEEAEKKMEKEATNSSAMKKNTTDQGPALKVKVRAKNYASPDCGAKIIFANPEAESSSSVLSASKDEYLLSPCTSKIWFVVELCEPMRAEKIELANFELYSSSPKDFTISVSNRFPTREWVNVGQFTAKDERNVQKYSLNPLVFGKFIRVEINSHYSKEHFCPISLFRVYGTSEFEAFETENHVGIIEGDILEGDDDDGDIETPESKKINAKNNIFKSASDAVLSIVKKAAEVLGKGDSRGDSNGTAQTEKLYAPPEDCFTFAYLINCVNCSRDEITHLLNCKHTSLVKLLQIPQLHEIIYDTNECSKLIDVEISAKGREISPKLSYFAHLLSLRHLIALCNLAAAVEKHIGLNPNLNIWNDSVTNTILPETEKSLMEKDKNAEKIKVIPLEGETTNFHNNSEVKTEKADKQTKDPTTGKEISAEGKNPPPDNSKDQQKKPKKDSSPGKDNGKRLPSIPESTPTNGNGNGHKQNEDSLRQNPSDSGNSVDGEARQEEQPQIELNNTDFREEASEDTKTQPNQLPIQQQQQQENPKEPTNGAGHESQHPQQPTNNDVLNNNLPPQGSAHSESVFLRLSNRIKALERNMSLSGQYLEELSKRYKKQVEELQTSFAKALLSIEDQSRRFDEKKEFMVMQYESLRVQCEDIMDKICKFCLVFGISFTCLQILIVYLYSRAYQRISRRCKMNCERKTLISSSDPDGKEIICNTSQSSSRSSSEESDKVISRDVTEIKEEDEEVEDIRNVSMEVEEVSISNSSGKISEDVQIEDLTSSEFELSTGRLDKSFSNHLETSTPRSEKNKSSFPLKETITRRLSSPGLFRTSRRKKQHSNSASKLNSESTNSGGNNHKINSDSLTKAPFNHHTISGGNSDTPNIQQGDESVIKKTGSFRRILKKVF
ncbi:hypothetical protein DMENIID0001_123290 [Sergentomyia squamirostris]